MAHVDDLKVTWFLPHFDFFAADIAKGVAGVVAPSDEDPAPFVYDPRDIFYVRQKGTFQHLQRNDVAGMVAENLRQLLFALIGRLLLRAVGSGIEVVVIPFVVLLQVL